MQALILAAGRGKKLDPLTEKRPKSMIYICEKPLLEYIITYLKEIGITEIMIVVGHAREKIMNYFGNGSQLGVNIKYIIQDEQKGIGDAILKAQNEFYTRKYDEYFFLIYGDLIVYPNIFKSTYFSFNSIRKPIAATCLTPNPELYGAVFLDSDVKITKFIEKPKELDPGNYILTGVFILSSGFFSKLKEVDGDMEKALESLVSTERELYGTIWDYDWVDLTFPWHMLSANKMLMKTWESAQISKTAKMEGNVIIDGPVHIDRNVTIASGAVIHGPCYIGQNSYIGNNALIREYTSIGANSIIGFGVELKNCVLFGNSKIGRLSFIGDSVLGENVNIGAGTMTVNEDINGENIKMSINGKTEDSQLKKLGAFIGDDVKIGANITLSPGLKISSNTKIPHKGDKDVRN
jgi:bifunctional UDP-N-acetylglucosamine pyrophosphorylase/glucosamine-1-phosphate N-acetyltransferase